LKRQTDESTLVKIFGTFGALCKMRNDFRIFLACSFGLLLSISAWSLVGVLGWTQFPFAAMAQEKMSELGTRLSTATVEKGYRSGVREPLQVVIRNQDEWNAFWKRHFFTSTNPPPAPIIDFNREMVVGIFLGEKRTGGYEVEIVRAERSDSALYFYYREKSPPPGAMVTQALTQPFHLVKLAKYENLQVIFRRDS
jgi:protease stability complex PrcB-like protein